MTKFKYAILFVLLVLLQVTFLSNINLGGYINPFLYIYFILVLPLHTSRLQLLLLAAALGLSIDIFLNTLGLHTFATVFVAYFRNGFISRTIPKDEVETLNRLTLYETGFWTYLKYAGSLTAVHHFLLYLLETFRLQGIFNVVRNTFYSTLFTLFLILLIQFLFVEKTKK